MDCSGLHLHRDYKTTICITFKFYYFMEKNKDFSSLENECVQGEESKQRQNQEMETLLNAESESVEGGRDIDDGSLNPSGMCSIMSCQTNT